MTPEPGSLRRSSTGYRVQRLEASSKPHPKKVEWYQHSGGEVLGVSMRKQETTLNSFNGLCTATDPSSSLEWGGSA